MASISFKRGTKASLEKEALKDGLLSFTTDDGKIHLDYIDENNELKRMTFYSGKLTFGDYVFDGTTDVDVEIYKGETAESETK